MSLQLPTDPVGYVLAYLLIGAIIWMLMNPTAYGDFMRRNYIARHGRLPSTGLQLIGHGVAIMRWPAVVWIFVVGFWRAAR